VDGSVAPVLIGALVPLTRPGWAEAGHHLLAGLELAASEVNDTGGIAGRPLELVVRDTAADPQRAAAAVDELARLGVAALAGEYHSVVARAAAARADALGLPFLCSSAVLDALTDLPTEWVARLAPAQSHGWRIYADFLLGAGHRRIAVAAQPSVYWESGARILEDHLAPRGGTVVELDMRALDPAAVCDELAGSRATALLLLVGHPEPAMSLVRAVRRDQRLAEIMIGAPAGQPELPSGRRWATTGPRSRSCATCPNVSVHSAHESRRPSASGWASRRPSSPSRATTRSPFSPRCCALPKPGRSSRSKAPAGGSSSPARRASAFGSGPGRRSRS
jgi:ABC-type branched-subunit amino acid transport system substrate-binding protein